MLLKTYMKRNNTTIIKRRFIMTKKFCKKCKYYGGEVEAICYKKIDNKKFNLYNNHRVSGDITNVEYKSNINGECPYFQKRRLFDIDWTKE